MQSNETRPEEKLFEPTVVESDFFILRVRSFEEKYHKTWFEFWTEFKDGRLDDPSNPDYGQWAVLCRAYWTELIISSGPPLNGFVSDQPERSSGFFII